MTLDPIMAALPMRGSDGAAATAGLGIVFVVLIFELLLLAGIYVLACIGYHMLFKKAGVPTWKAWVPFVQNWTYAQLGGYHGAWMFVPYAGWIMPGIAINKAFGKNDAGSIIGLILLGSIWSWILGAGSAPFRPELMGTDLEQVRASGANVPAWPAAPTPYGASPNWQAGYGAPAPQQLGSWQPGPYGAGDPGAQQPGYGYPPQAPYGR